MASARVLFFGYSEVGYAALELLLARGVPVVGVFTHAQDPNEAAWFRSVPGLAAAHQLPVFTPESLKDPVWEERIRALRPDLILSMYYRNMIPTRLLDLAPLGAFNMHGSYLPRYRGRAPLNWAIIHGEDHTGVSLHVMVKEADAGDLVDQEKVPIGPDEPVTTVIPRVRDAAVAVLGRQLDALLSGHPPVPPKITPWPPISANALRKTAAWIGHAPPATSTISSAPSPIPFPVRLPMSFVTEKPRV
jgi:methionyl-tRNA formyltransferase